MKPTRTGPPAGGPVGSAGGCCERVRRRGSRRLRRHERAAAEVAGRHVGAALSACRHSVRQARSSGRRCLVVTPALQPLQRPCAGRAGALASCSTCWRRQGRLRLARPRRRVRRRGDVGAALVRAAVIARCWGLCRLRRRAWRCSRSGAVSGTPVAPGAAVLDGRRARAHDRILVLRTITTAPARPSTRSAPQ